MTANQLTCRKRPAGIADVENALFRAQMFGRLEGLVGPQEASEGLPRLVETSKKRHGVSRSLTS
eukprot:7894856-Pyramimonas_sp.AAC.1